MIVYDDLNHPHMVEADQEILAAYGYLLPLKLPLMLLRSRSYAPAPMLLRRQSGYCKTLMGLAIRFLCPVCCLLYPVYYLSSFGTHPLSATCFLCPT